MICDVVDLGLNESSYKSLLGTDTHLFITGEKTRFDICKKVQCTVFYTEYNIYEQYEAEKLCR